MVDPAEEVVEQATKVLYFKAERTVEERADGRFRAHFYGKFSELLGKKAPSKPWQLRITKGHLMLDIAEDMSPWSSSARMEVDCRRLRC